MPRRKIIVVTGLPGTGKTTFARAMSEATGAHHLFSDQIREQIGKRGAYDPKNKDEVYNFLIARAVELLDVEQIVIVDATFSKEKWRKMLKERCHAIGVDLFWICLTASEDTIKKRVSKTRPYSQADFGVYQKLKKEFDELNMHHLPLSSDRLSLEEMVGKAISYIGYSE